MTQEPYPQSGLPDSRLPVAASGDAGVQAHQRAPTLMAGEAAGVQGQVRVWTPDEELVGRVAGRLRRQAVLGLCLAPVYLLMYTDRHRLLFLLGALVWLLNAVVFFRESRRTRRRPIYLTTDEAGIGITNRTGSLAVRWSEILSLADVTNNQWRTVRLSLEGRRRLTDISLATYPRAQQEELIGLIRQKAHLTPQSSRTYRRALPANVEHPALAPRR